MLEKTRENEIHVEMVEEPPAKSIAFGIERLGLIPMKAPILSCIILAVSPTLISIQKTRVFDTVRRASCGTERPPNQADRFRATAACWVQG